MAITIWPANATNGVPAVAGRGLRQTSVGVPLAGATAARPLGVRSGVRPGTPSFTVTVSGKIVNVAPHAGVIDGQTAAEAGGYEYSSDAVVPVQTNLTQDASNPRVDLVSVQVSDPSESDGTSVAAVQFVYTQGIAAAAPLAPGDSGSSVAAPARSFPLARINVPRSGGGNPTVSWVAPYLTAAGGVLPVDTLANLKQIAGAFGQTAVVWGDATSGANAFYGWNATANRWDQLAVNQGLSNWSSSSVPAWAPVSGYQPIMQTFQIAGRTDGGGRLAFSFPFPFPNGIAFVLPSPHNNTGHDSDYPPIVVETSPSKTGATLFFANRASTQVYIPVLAIGF